MNRPDVLLSLVTVTVAAAAALLAWVVAERRRNTTAAREIARLRDLALRRAEQVSVLSHEVRTPLALIKGSADLLVEETPGPLTDVQRKFVGTISDSAQHVISLGHTVIAHIGGDPALDRDFRVGAKRRAAYEATLRDAGLPVDDRLVRTGDFTMDGGYQAALQLLGDPAVAPTAIVCASDEMAMGALLAARDLGREIPADLSVIGIDGHTLGEFWALTTVAQFPEAQGRLAAEALLRELDGEEVAKEHFSVPIKLVVRRSTRALQQPR